MNKALPGLPRPLPDELLYSVIARAALHLGHWSPKGLLETIYGRRNILATPDLPSSLSLIADLTQEAWGMTLVELALRHTLVGYYTHFLGEVRQRQVIAAMAGKSAHLHLRLGICAGTVRSITRFRMCPVCAEDDVRQFGHTYWHRSHQLPGVLVCPLHEVVLLTCSTPFRPVGRHEHVAAIPQMLSTSQWQKRPADWPSASHLARECSALLDAPATTEGPLHDYRPLLAPLGFHRKRDGLTRFTEAFRLRWGSELISQLFTQQDTEKSLRWLEEIARKPRRPIHPLKHLLIRGCISGEWPEIEECAQEIAGTKTWGIYRSNTLRKEAAALCPPDTATMPCPQLIQGDKYMMNLPIFRRRMLLAAVAVSWAGCTWAQQGKPLRLIVPLTTGSAVDALARALTPELIKAFDRPVFVENLAGAGGTTGTLQVVRAPKDGATLGLVASGHVINPYIFKAMPFDAVKDITPISVLAYSPLVLVVNPSVPAKDQRELIALLKANPNKFNYGSAGNGSIAQLAASLFAKEAGIAIQHIPYRGVGPLMTDLVGGQVQMAFIGTSAAQSQVAAGKLRAIGVSSTTRAALMPAVPTIAEGGLAGFHYEPWIAAIGPAGLSIQQTAALAAGFKAAISAPSVREVLAGQGFVAVANAPEQAAAFVSSEFKRHEKLVKDSGAVLE